MPQSSRTSTIAQIAGLLIRRFPQVPLGHITDTVATEYDALAENPIRLYISNLVEHAARSRLVMEAVGSR